MARTTDEPIKNTPRKKRHGCLIVLIILLLLIIGIAIYGYYYLSKIPTHDLDMNNVTINDIDEETLSGYENIAIFGTDSRDNELLSSTRTDCIMIASINRETNDVKLVSIYRDTYVDIDNVGFSKINAAYANGGPELAISTINKHFDLDITEFITVNFSALTNIVDAVGGVELDIQEDELTQINNYTKDMNKINGTNSPTLSSSGKQTLNGTQATAYCRVRYTSGNDFRRTERQRNVIYGIMNKVKSNVTVIPSIINELLPQVYTSLSTKEILSLGTNALSYNIVEDTGFPFEKKTPYVATASGKSMSVVYADDLVTNVIELHEFLFGTTDYTPSSTVQELSTKIANVNFYYK